MAVIAVGFGPLTVSWAEVTTTWAVLAGCRWLVEALCYEGPDREKAVHRLVAVIVGYVAVRFLVL